MIHFERVPEPPDFDRVARQPGLAWLAANPEASRPRDLWSPFRSHLADGFRDLCSYSAMFDANGTVDHFLSCKARPDLIYEWSNYRYASSWLNSCKRNADDRILDPHEVQDGWFEILLPSLQLVVTNAIPPQVREKAEYTLRRLRLGDDERVIRQRRAWYGLYQEGKITLEGLRERAPLLARAIDQESGSS